MSENKDHLETRLPITAELGDEGGSFGDATLQAETFSGSAGNPRIDPTRVTPGEEAPTPVPERERAREMDTVKHATEPPDMGEKK
jgi:hypothetical protein